MRTTLKRGVGRGAVVNGDGRAILPPGALTPITRYRQPQRRRSVLEIFGKALLVLLAAALSLVTGVSGGYYLLGAQAVEDISDRSKRNPSLRAAAERLKEPLPGGPAIAMVIGHDRRAKGVDATLESRSDTVMLLRADPQGETLSMLSLPRDLVVEVRCPGKLPFQGRVNEAFTYCGPKGSLETVKGLTGLPINYLITVDFLGFIQIVDKLGGVWMDVDRRYFNDNSGYGPNYATIDLKPGYQKLSGRDALDFVRYRHTDSDLYRLERQKLFLRAVKERISSSFKLRALPKVIRAIVNNVEVGVAGGKSLEPKTVRSWAFFAYGLPAGNVFRTKIEGLTGYDQLSTDPSNVQAAVDELLTPDVEAAEKATAAALGQRAKLRSGPPAESISLVVLNGNGITGSAANASYLLSRRGFKTLPPPEGVLANAPSREFRTKVYFDPRRRHARAAAQKVANLFGSRKVAPMSPKIAPFANGAMLVVVVGQTFHNTLAPAPIDRTPKHQPPAVVRNPGATLALLRSVRRKADFQLQIPTLLERTSAPDPEPIRVYEIDGHKTVRLTFRTGASEYWGIQQTDWNDAPLLEGRNVTRVIGGREYDLYYDGARLHMVVLREDGATYWVVNTLLDRLSNETMLAIAKGLRRLARK